MNCETWLFVVAAGIGFAGGFAAGILRSRKRIRGIRRRHKVFVDSWMKSIRDAQAKV